MEKLAIACDHGGYDLKEAIKKHFAQSVEFIDLGTNSSESVDYPEYGQAVAQAIINENSEKGVLICGSGIGISIAANRYPQIRAANCVDPTMAKLSRLHNNANVLALGARLIDEAQAIEIVKTFLETEYEGGRHDARIQKMSQNI